jgi:Ca-activated chloride channel family protein
MPSVSLKTILSVLLTVASAFLCSDAVRGQAKCLNEDDIKRMLTQVNSSSSVSPNKKLRETLLKLKEKDQKSFQESITENRKADALMDQMRTSRDKNTAKFCPILKEFGWPGTNLVGQDGVAAAFYLLKNSSSVDLQRDLLPVIIAATRKGEIEREDFAGYIDHLRLSAGLKQLFGTQATIKNGFLVLYPIEAEAHVDDRRRQYDLMPLAMYIRVLQRIYRLPLVRSTGQLTNTFAETPNSAIAKTTATDLFEGETVAEDEIVRIETNLVNLNVSVYSNKLKTRVNTLEQKDFIVFEDTHQETISFFASTDFPCDLVLLIDLSGSTSSKRDLIRQTTQRFIEAARPSDRLAIVTFSNTTNIISPLTSDRKQLMESAATIEGAGGSNVWDALKFTLDQVVGPRTFDRRRAVVFMTDGADSSLLMGAVGSKILFADLVETVRRNDTLIIPIYLDTEGDDAVSKRVYENARKTLKMLAEESGGLYYTAKKIEDLSEVYAQVIEDLGKVYSLGYNPRNAKRDGSWRTVKIKIPNRPDLITHARPGYYSR